MKSIKLYCIFLISFFSFSQGKIVIEGTVVDAFGTEIPYAAVGILKKNIGTTTTDEGTFSFIVSAQEADDIFEISSIGFETFKINVRQYVQGSTRTIVLEEQVSALSEVVVLSPGVYVKTALKKLRQNTISANHQLKLLYRRWSVEDQLCRYYIEHHINVVDRGPSSYMVNYAVDQRRVSADYRFVKNAQKIHAVRYMEMNNPLRRGLNYRAYTWKKLTPSTYDGEDVLVLEGTKKNKDMIRLYIGFDTYKIYKLEMAKKPETNGKLLTATYVYKKNSQGKLYLSYHVREWQGGARMPENVKRALIASGQKARQFIPIAYRHEVFVLSLEENKKKFAYSGETANKDMAAYAIPYRTSFWKNISLPPETGFFKKNRQELESHYGVSLETQFEFANN